MAGLTEMTYRAPRSHRLAGKTTPDVADVEMWPTRKGCPTHPPGRSTGG